MASTIVFGTIGSGKTYYLVRYVLRNYNRYDHVVSNFPIIIPKKPVLQWDQNYITSGLNNTLYVLDEAWALWNSRDFANFNTDIQEWFALSRHYNNHVMLATQAVTRLDKTIRELAQDFVFVHSWKMFWLKQPRPLFMTAVHYDHVSEDAKSTGISQPLREPIRTERFPFRFKIARYYDTHAKLTQDPDAYFKLTPEWTERDLGGIVK